MYIIDLMRLTSCILLPRTFRVAQTHAHDAYEAHYVIGGRGSFETEEEPVSVRAGDFFYTRPGTMHRMDVPKRSYLLQYIAFLELDRELDAALAQDLDALLGEGKVRHLGDRYHPLFAQLSRQFLEYLNHNGIRDDVFDVVIQDTHADEFDAGLGDPAMRRADIPQAAAPCRLAGPRLQRVAEVVLVGQDALLDQIAVEPSAEKVAMIHKKIYAKQAYEKRTEIEKKSMKS